MLSIDAVRLGLIWQRLNGMADEVAESFIRSSFSSVVRENSDMAFSLLIRKGDNSSRPAGVSRLS